MDAFSPIPALIGGALIEGTLHPEVIAEDLKMVARDVYWKRIIKPALRRRKNAATRAMKRPIKQAAAAVTGAAGNTVASAKAAAIGAAWDWQTGGAPDPDCAPEPVNPCPVCTDGYIQLDTSLHTNTRVRCSVCHGTGDID